MFNKVAHSARKTVQYIFQVR